MADELTGRTIALLTTDGVEAVELSEPKAALEAAGATCHIVAPQPGSIQGMNHLDKGPTFTVDRVVSDVAAGDYDGLVIPGGVAGADKLRTSREAVAFVRDFAKTERPIAAICHGPWLLVEAGLAAGHVFTSWPSLQTDIRNAGGAWVDEVVHVDGRFITSRQPDDLPDFCKRIIESFASGRAQGSASPKADTTLKERNLDLLVEETFPASDPMPTPSKT